MGFFNGIEPQSEPHIFSFLAGLKTTKKKKARRSGPFTKPCLTMPRHT
jgi:hypothetical protein